jgi:tetratricopeptide (TPR) repeat protein
VSLTRAQKSSGVFALSVCVLLATRSSRASTGWDRNGFDSDDADVLDHRDAALGALLRRGEAELHAGATQAAADSFKSIVDRAPDNSLAYRRYCQALTELGERPAALAACQTAIDKRQSAPAFRALVGALMSDAPTPEDLDLASRLANAAQRRMSDQPWGLAAFADIAKRTGDEKMLESTVLELERIAPGHYETLRARQALDSFHLPTWAWGAWLGLGAGALGTLVHFAWSGAARARSRRRVLTVAASIAVATGTLLSAGRASADTPKAAPTAAPDTSATIADSLSKWPVDEQDPNKTVPTPEQRDANPLEFGYHLMDLADKADIARKKGDFAAVGRYYEAIAKAVPDRAIGYRKACDGYDRAGDPEKALAMCRGALAADGVEILDYTHFAKLVLGKDGALSATDIEDLTEMSTHLKAEQAGMSAGLQIQCDLAERLDDVKRLEDCTAAVAKETPDDPKLVIYEWGIAMKKEDYKHARQLIEQARKSSLRPAGVDVMERTTKEQSAIGRRLSRAVERHPVGIAIGIALLAALAFGAFIRRRLGLRLGLSRASSV